MSSVRASNVNHRAWQFFLLRRTARWADAFTAVSQRTLEFAAAHEGLAPDRARVIPNGIDLSEWDAMPDRTKARAELDVPADAFVVTAVGRLHPQKGYEYLLPAAKKVCAEVADSVFLIAGYGPSERELKALAQRLGVERTVRFLGYRTDVQRLLAACDVFALPSLWEGMSNALLEAMAAGRAVVATAVDGNVEQVVPDETGLLAPARDADALATALLSLARDPDRARRMGEAGRKRVREKFSLAAMTGAYLALYDELLKE